MIFRIWSTRYPALRVAYVEEKEEIIGNKPQKVYSSVLVRGANGYDQVMHKVQKEHKPRPRLKARTYNISLLYMTLDRNNALMSTDPIF